MLRVERKWSRLEVARRLRRRKMKTGTRLRMLRAERKWSQLEVARRLGRRNAFRYWRIENGYEDATPAERRALAAMFDTTPADLFGGDVVDEPVTP